MVFKLFSPLEAFVKLKAWISGSVGVVDDIAWA